MGAETVHCPLVNKAIDRLDCVDAAFVAEGIQPERFALKELRLVSNFKEICNKCTNHPD